MSGIDMLLLILATWWLAYTLTSQKGPVDILVKLREKIPLGGLTACVYCLSIWIAILVFMVWLSPFQLAVYPFAFAGGAMLLHRYAGF